MVGDMQKFMQFQAANAVEKSAENPSGGNAGVDMGTGFAMGQMMMNMMNQNQQGQGGGQSAAPSKDDIMDTLKKLGELKKEGLITEEEFNEKKKELLAKL